MSGKLPDMKGWQPALAPRNPAHRGCLNATGHISAIALIFRKGALVLNIVALLLNLAALGVVACIVCSLSHMRLM